MEESIESSINLVGKLLIATPKLCDKAFARTVIFLTSYSHLEATGIILNRPTYQWVEHFETPYTDPVILNSPVYQGGCLNKDELAVSAWIWHKSDHCFELRYHLQEEDVAGLDYIGNDIQIRSFLGYVGWGPFQLIAKILSGWWYPVKMGNLFGLKGHGEGLWHAIVEKTNPGIKLLSDYPEDSKWNLGEAISSSPAMLERCRISLVFPVSVLARFTLFRLFEFRLLSGSRPFRFRPFVGLLIDLCIRFVG